MFTLNFTNNSLDFRISGILAGFTVIVTITKQDECPAKIAVKLDGEVTRK